MYKDRSALKAFSVATERIRAVLRLAGQENMTTQNLGKPKKNTAGYR